jgi:hypothetical protein
MKISSWLWPAVASLAALAAAGCGTTGGGTQPASARQAATTPATPAEYLGRTFRLAGFSSAESLEVTATRTLADPVAASRTASPASGMRYFAVSLRLTAGATSGFTLSPWQDATVQVAGHAYDTARAKVRGCRAFGALVKLAPGQEKSGCLVFQVPAGARVTQVLFALEPGRTADLARWTVMAVKSGRPAPR